MKILFKFVLIFVIICLQGNTFCKKGINSTSADTDKIKFEYKKFSNMVIKEYCPFVYNTHKNQ